MEKIVEKIEDKVKQVEDKLEETKADAKGIIGRVEDALIDTATAVKEAVNKV
jgi:hypothetical protein